MSRRLLRDLDGEDPYRLLGVDNTADNNTIIRAYRQRIREVHPDLPSGSEEKTKLLHIARDVLLDPDTRAEYDRLSTDGGAATDHAPSGSAWDGEDVVAGPVASPERDTWAPPPPQPPRYTYPPQPQRPSPPLYQPPPVYVYPPQQYPPGAPQARIDSNMTMSVVSVFLFWPLAIPAIVYASKVVPALRVGDYATAQRAAADSRRWSRLALIVGLAWIGLYLVCCCVGILSQRTGQTSPTSP